MGEIDMIDIEYANAYSEVLEILKYIPIKDYNKIPKNIIELFEKNANNEHRFIYNPNKTLDEQNVTKRAKAIIAILFTDYWANKIQREKIIQKQNYDRIKLNEEKREKYNPDNIFKNREIRTIENTTSNIVSMIAYKESAFKRLLNKIKSIFAKK